MVAVKVKSNVSGATKSWNATSAMTGVTVTLSPLAATAGLPICVLMLAPQTYSKSAGSRPSSTVTSSNSISNDVPEHAAAGVTEVSSPNSGSSMMVMANVSWAVQPLVSVMLN